MHGWTRDVHEQVIYLKSCQKIHSVLFCLELRNLYSGSTRLYLLKVYQPVSRRATVLQLSVIYYMYVKGLADMCILCSVYFLGIYRLLFLLLCLILQVHVHVVSSCQYKYEFTKLLTYDFFSTFRVHTMCINCCLSLKKCYM